MDGLGGLGIGSDFIGGEPSVPTVSVPLLPPPTLLPTLGTVSIVSMNFSSHPTGSMDSMVFE